MQQIPTFLSKCECEFFINFHEDCWRFLAKDFHGNKVIPFTPLLQDYRFRYVYTKICAHIQSIDPNLYPNNVEIVKWHEGKNQESHLDFDYHPYTSIIYLNDNYDGGQTFVDKEIVTPETGKMITFKGAEIPHGVNKIEKGTRYTIPIWYKDIRHEDK